MGTACLGRAGASSRRTAARTLLLILVASLAAAQDDEAKAGTSSEVESGGGDDANNDNDDNNNDRGLKVKPPNDGAVPNCPRCPKFTVPEGCGYIPSTAARERRRRRVLLEAIAEREDEDEEESVERADHPGSGASAPSSDDGADYFSRRASSSSTRDLGGDVGGGGRGRRNLLQRARGGGGGGGRGRPGLRVRAKKGTARQSTFAPPSDELTARAVAVLTRWKGMDQADMCGLWTKHCIEGYLKKNDSIGMNIERSWHHPRHPLKRIFKKGVVPDETEWDKWFPEIDAHDTVIRYNAPLKTFKSAVGSKSDVLYWKVRGEEKEYGQEGQKPGRYVMFKDETKLWMVAKPKDIAENKYLGKPILWPSPRRGEYFSDVVYEGYKTEKRLTRGAASGGYKLAGDVLASGLCTRVDVYGYTSKGTAKYFNKGKAMSTVHIMGLEHWAYRLAQQEGMMCVYD